MKESTNTIYYLVGFILLLFGLGVIYESLVILESLIKTPGTHEFLTTIFTWVASADATLASEINNPIMIAIIKVTIIAVYAFILMKIAYIGIELVKEGVRMIRNAE